MVADGRLVAFAYRQQVNLGSMVSNGTIRHVQLPVTVGAPIIVNRIPLRKRTD